MTSCDVCYYVTYLAGNMDQFWRRTSLVSTREIASSTSCVKKCLLRLKCCNHNELETFGHLTNTATPAFACNFHPDALDGQLLITGDEEGSLVLRDCRKPLSTEESWLIGIGAHRNAIFDLSWVEGTNQVVTASADQTLKLWDMSAHKVVTVMMYHNASVKTVSVSPVESSVMVSGGRDGLLNLWDLRYSPKACGHHRPVSTVRGAHSGSPLPLSRKRSRQGQRVSLQMSKEGQSSSVTAVKFVGEHYIASAGTADGGIKIWDKRKLCSLNQQHVPVHTFQMQSKSMRKPGFTSLVHDTHRSCLYAVGTDSLIYCYDTLCFGGQPNNIMSGHSCYSYYVKAAISPDNSLDFMSIHWYKALKRTWSRFFMFIPVFLLCGSSCSNAFVWDLQEPYSRPYVLSGHTKEVTCVAWSPKLVDLVATCSDDTSLRVWHSGTPPVHKTQTTCTCIGVCGLYDGELHTTGKKLMETHVWQSDPKTPDKENTPPATDDSDHFSTPTSSKKPNIVQKSLHSYFGLSRN